MIIFNPAIFVTKYFTMKFRYANYKTILEEKRSFYQEALNSLKISERVAEKLIEMLDDSLPENLKDKVSFNFDFYSSSIDVDVYPEVDEVTDDFLKEILEWLHNSLGPKFVSSQDVDIRGRIIFYFKKYNYHTTEIMIRVRSGRNEIEGCEIIEKKELVTNYELKCTGE